MKEMDFLSDRGQHTVKWQDFLSTYLLECMANPFHPKQNSKGKVNLGTAESNLMDKEITEYINGHRLVQFDSRRHQHYFDFSGLPSLRAAFSDFFHRYFKTDQPIDPNQIMVFNGGTTCLDVLAHALFDRGDVFITPTPVYARVYTDLYDRSEVQPCPLYIKSQVNEEGESFSLHLEDLENLIEGLLSDGKKVKGLVLLNPHNPLGDIIPPDRLRGILNLCAKYRMHVIIDEVYALSVFEKHKDEFHSILAMQDVPDPQRTHFVWSLSKDLCLAGFRTAVIHTKNKGVLECLRKLAYYHNVPSIVQSATEKIITDNNWLDNVYFPTNRSRLTSRYTKAAQMLQQAGLKVRPGKAGLFIWFNISHAIGTNMTFEDEMKFFEEAFEEGVYVVPGKEFYCESPGWIRLTFAVSEETLQIGIERLTNVIDRWRKSPTRASGNGTEVNGSQ